MAGANGTIRKIVSMTPQTSPNVTDLRAAGRSSLFLAATISVNDRTSAIRIRDLSSSGAQMEGADLPEVDLMVLISRGDLSVTGKVVWRRQQRCGVRFDNSLLLDDWLAGKGHRGQRRVDRIISKMRSGKFLPETTPDRSSCGDPRLLAKRIADELAYVTRLLEGLSEGLANEPATVMRHLAELQDLDVASQILGHLGSIITSHEPDAAMRAIGMESLRRRLTHGSCS